MEACFVREFQVTPLDSDMYGLCRPSSLMGFLQHMATEHSVDQGISRDSMIERYNCAWLLIRTQFSLLRPLWRYETVRAVTWTPGVVGAYHYRNIELTQGGEVVGTATQAWVLADQTDRRLIRMDRIPEIVNVPKSERTPFPVLPKLRLPKEMPERMRRPVRYSDTDYNAHMNNTRYVDIACDAFHYERMQGMFLQEAQIQYTAEFLPGEEIFLHGMEQDGQYLAAGLDEAGKTRVEMRLKFAAI